MGTGTSKGKGAANAEVGFSNRLEAKVVKKVCLFVLAKPLPDNTLT
jgi:hypothetical protein